MQLSRLLSVLRDTAFRIIANSRRSIPVRESDRIRLRHCPGRHVRESRRVRHAPQLLRLMPWKSAMSASALTFEISAARKRDSTLLERIGVCYAPIVSLLDGSLYGYEAIPCDRLTGERWQAERFFAMSEDEGALYDNDRKFRELAIPSMTKRANSLKLFLPVSPRIIYDPRLYPGSALNRIEAAGLRPEQVVLILTDTMNGHAGTSHAALRHYRLQGFRIALSGIGPERVIDRMIELKPDFARIGSESMLQIKPGARKLASGDRVAGSPGEDLSCWRTGWSGTTTGRAFGAVQAESQEPGGKRAGMGDVEEV